MLLIFVLDGFGNWRGESVPIGKIEMLELRWDGTSYPLVYVGWYFARFILSHRICINISDRVCACID